MKEENLTLDPYQSRDRTHICKITKQVPIGLSARLTSAYADR